MGAVLLPVGLGSPLPLCRAALRCSLRWLTLNMLPRVLDLGVTPSPRSSSFVSLKGKDGLLDELPLPLPPLPFLNIFLFSALQLIYQCDQPR